MRTLREALLSRVLVLDGAMGTMVQARDLTAADFGGPEYEGCNEHLNLTRPDVVTAIHAAYLDAGADVISTNTFGCAPYVLAEYGLSERAYEITLAAARLARAAAGERFVLGAMGPSTRSISVTRNVTFAEVLDAYALQARALLEGGVDALLLETCQDTLNVKAATLGIRQAMREAGRERPLMVSATIEPMGTMLAGQGVEALYVSLQHLGLLSIGLNCATGPEFMTDHLRSLAAIVPCFVSVYPNAGLPDERGQYGETPAEPGREDAPLPRRGLGQPHRRLLRDDARAHPRPRRARAWTDGSRAARRRAARRERDRGALSLRTTTARSSWASGRT